MLASVDSSKVEAILVGGEGGGRLIDTGLLLEGSVKYKLCS